MPNGPNGNLHYDFEDISNTEKVPDSQLNEGTGQLFLPVGRVTPGDVELERVSVSRLLSFVQGTLGTHPTSLFRQGTTAPDAVDKREGIAQLYLYQAIRNADTNPVSLFQLYYHSGVLSDNWQRITSPPQVYFQFSRPDSEKVFWSYLEHGSANILWIVFNTHNTHVLNRPASGLAYYENAGGVRDAEGNVIPRGARSDETRLVRGTLARVVSGTQWTDEQGNQHRVTTSPDVTVWRLFGTLLSEASAPFWEYSADGTSWHRQYADGDTLARQNLNAFGGQNANPTSPDAQTTPAFVIHQPVEPAETTEFGLANMENEPVGTAQTGTLGQVWNFPATTATAPRHYFNVPTGKRVLHILNVALGGAQETRNEWQLDTTHAIHRYVRQPPMGRTGQYRVIFE